MGKVKKGVKKFQKKIAGGGVHKKKKLHFRRDKADAAKAAQVQEQAVAAERKKSDKAKPAKRAPAELSVDDFLDGGFMSVDVQQDQLSDSGDSEAEAGDDAATMDSDAEQDAHDMTAADDAGSASESDDDAADTEADPVRAQNKQYKTEIASHQAQLEALREQDPEFYEYLQQTDQELLKFGQDDDEEEEGTIEDASEDDQEATARLPMEEAEEQQQPSTSGQQKHVSRAMVQAWCNAAKANASPAAMHKLLQAYRLACHYGDTEEQVHETMKISSSAVFNRLMLFVLKEGHHIFLRMLSLDELTTVTARDVQRSKRMKKVEGLLKSFLGNSLHLLGQMTDSAMLTFTLRRLRASVILLAPFVKLQRKFLRQVLTIFGGADKAPRLQALLFIRHMAAMLPPPALELALKGVYRTFVQNAKFVNAASVPHIHFMASCVVEMFGLDMAASYQQAFTGIRQLAVLLRGALAMRTKDAFREVYCWQTVNCLELWAKVLAAHADKQELRPLVYPLTQVLLGTVRLVPTPRYFPLRLRCIRALLGLGKAVGQFIPLSPLLLEMLQVIELLAEHLSLWSCSIAFPELAHLPLLHLRKFGKQCKVERFRTSSRALADALERNMAFVSQRRQQVDFSPKDTAQVNTFLQTELAAHQAPLQKYALVLREKAVQRRAMQSSDELSVPRKASLIDGASDSEEEEEAPMKQSEREDDAQEADEQGQGAFEGSLLPAKGEGNGKQKAVGKQSSKSRPAAEALSAGDDDQEDVLQDYELSDDSNMEE
ncbi:TPA: hypothetical protein ACH3X2_005684 [Trebouxia sp. C0005]